MKLESILREPEGKTLEFKRDLSSHRPVVRTLVAFANSAGGRLLVGVDDVSRDVVGVPDPLDAEERLANLIADSIEPPLLPEIEVLPWRRGQVLAVRVAPSALRPHCVKSEGAQGVYVRLGSTNRRADAALISEMRRWQERLAHDEEPVASLDYEDIDFAAASQCFADVRKLRKQDLASLGLLTRLHGREVPTVGGIVLFGRERLAHFPDAWIQAGYFAGSDKSAPIRDQADIVAYPVDAVAQAVAFVQRNTRRGSDIRGLVRRDRPDVPPVALREAIVNAVVHADYSQRGAPTRVAVFDDRVEIENPGILLPGLTVEELRDGVSRLRNRVIGRVFKELGLVEQWGSGIQRMAAACRAAGLPEPEFEEVGLRFRVTLRTDIAGRPEVGELDQALLEYVDVPHGRSTSEIAAFTGRSTRAAQQRLRRLQDAGLVVVIGSSPNDPRKRWHRRGGMPGS